MNEVNRYLWRLSKWTLLALAIVVTLSIVAKASEKNLYGDYARDPAFQTGLDYDGVNPGLDKKCLRYEDCPEWDGDPDTKVYYDLMKLKNGTGIIPKSDFNWNVHLYTCHQNKLLDSINGKGSFEIRAILSVKDGMVPCPIDTNPHWSYDWESHILKAKLKRLALLWHKDFQAGPSMGEQFGKGQSPQNSIDKVE